MNQPMSRYLLCVAAAILLFMACASHAATTAARPQPKAAVVRIVAATGAVPPLYVKFKESAKVRLRGGALRNLAGDAATGEQLASLDREFRRPWSMKSRGAAIVTRTFQRLEGELDADRALRSKRSGRALPDLNSFFTIHFGPDATAAEAEALANVLNRLPVVESVHVGMRVVPASADIAPATPSYETRQRYLDDKIAIGSVEVPGLGARHAWARPGGRGEGGRILFYENDWDNTHEDLPAPTLAGMTRPTASDPATDYAVHHAANTVGIVVAADNGYGVTGIASAAQYGLAQLGSPSDLESLASSLLRPGDVVSMSVGFVENTANLRDASGNACSMNPPPYANAGPNAFVVPVDYSPPYFAAIQHLTAAGIHVVLAAGNSAANFDDPCLAPMYAGDSGAIVVGAGQPYYRDRLYFSNYGNRVNVQGWGEQVVTTGRNAGRTLFTLNPPDHRQGYEPDYGGTSAAAPMVAGVMLALQGVRRQAGKALFTPAQMRQLLVELGTPGNPADRIGPLPNLKATLAWMDADADGDGISNADELAAGGQAGGDDPIVTPHAVGQGSMTPGGPVSVPRGGTATFTLSPQAGYVAVIMPGSTSCGGQISGNTYTTAPRMADCTASIGFFQPPAPPQDIRVTPGDGQLFVHFKPAAAYEGALAKLRYTADCGGARHTAAAPPLVVAGLANGAAVSCTVTATNVAGTGPASAAVVATPDAGAPLTLVAVHSRKSHGAAGDFNLVVDPAPPAGARPAIEMRAGAAHRLVFIFNRPVTSVGNASLAGGGQVAGVTVQGHEVVMELSQVPERRRVTASLSNINNAGLAVSAPFAVLGGDINQDGAVNVLDVSAIRAAASTTPDARYFVLDGNADGVVNTIDIAAARARSGWTLD